MRRRLYDSKYFDLDQSGDGRLRVLLRIHLPLYLRYHFFSDAIRCR
jgi:hypothetical protein